MSLRRADTRFLLPRTPRSAAIIGGLPGWPEGLEQAGVEPAPPERADLVVAPASAVKEALALDPELLLLEGGRPLRRLRASGRATSSALSLPDRQRPELLLPVGHGAAVRYAVERWRPGAGWAARTRNATARELVARGGVPPGRPLTVVASRGGGLPFVVAPALDLLRTRRVRLFCSFGPWAHPFSRGAFFLFPDDAREPACVVKFARLPDRPDLFDGDERGLRLAERLGGSVSAHAPRLLGRYEVDGTFASVETAATGERLAAALVRTTSHTVVDRIAGWIVDVARGTAAPPETLAPERRRLATEVVPRWADEGATAALVEELPPVAAVFRHADLWADNLFVRDDSFVAVDWESAQEHGPPLWDLLYFLNDALERIDGAVTDAERRRHFVRLWRGELPASATAFRWVRAAAAATQVPPEAVGPLATLLWLSLSVSDAAHVDRVGAVTGAADLPPPPTAALARSWLHEPGLGPGWSAWRSY